MEQILNPKNKITIIDSIMGSGKTSKLINYMKQNMHNERFMYITPYLKEVTRIKEEVKDIIEPRNIKGSKLNHIRTLTKEGKNIVSTHALLSKFDKEIQEHIEIGEYTLVLDEVANVVEEHYFNTISDKEDFFKYYAYIDDEGYVIWDEEKHPSDEYSKGSKFYEEMILCQNRNLVQINDKLLMWELPVEIFKKFNKVIILTYLFKGSVQKPYLDLFQVKYDMLSIKNNEIISYQETSKEEKEKIKSLINLIDKPSLNRIGEDYYALSSTWYSNNIQTSGDNIYYDRLKKNTYTFFKTSKAKSKDSLWSTFKTYQHRLSGKGYTKGFLEFNTRATNEYRDKSTLAYLLNVFPHTSLVMYFQQRNSEHYIDRDSYALSILIQWIWRSRIRNSNQEDSLRKIDLYLPSRRMRNLLLNWLEK